jgi:6-phosphogluconolactonase
MEIFSMTSRIRRTSRRFPLSACALVFLTAATIFLSGCGSFFSCEGKASCPAGGSTGSNSGSDFAYVSNSASGSTYLNGYVISTSGALTATTGSPYQLSYTPQAMAITPNNSFIYIASDSVLNSGVGYLYGYSIATTGALTILNSGKALESESIASVDVSPDGAYLFCLDIDGSTVQYYAIDSSTGALTYQNTVSYSGATSGIVTPSSIKVAPSNDFVALTLGTAGMVTFPFDTTTGVTGPGETLYTPATASTGIFGLAIDKNNDIYASGTAGLQVFTSTTAGVPSLLTAYPTDAGPDSVAINPLNTYVYTGNKSATTTAGSISGFSIATGPALTAVTNSPFTAPEDVSSIGIDNTGDYLLAAGLNSSSGIQLYSIGSTGSLTVVSGTSVPTGTTLTIPTVVAMTH